MLYREIIAVCSEIHTKHINTLCEQNVELLNVKLANSENGRSSCSQPIRHKTHILPTHKSSYPNIRCSAKYSLICFHVSKIESSILA